MSYWIAGATVVSAVAGAASSSSAASSAAGQQQAAITAAEDEQAHATQVQTRALAPYVTVGGAANKQLATLLGLDGFSGGAQGDVTKLPGWASYVAAGGYTGAAGQTDSDSDQAARQALYNEADLNINSDDPAYGSLTKPITMADVSADPVYSDGLQFGLDTGVKGIQQSALAGGTYDSGNTLKALTEFGNDYGTTKTQAGVNDINTSRNNLYSMLSGTASAGQSAVNSSNGVTQTGATNQSNLLTSGGNVAAAGTVASANAYSGIGSQVSAAYSNANSSNNSQSILQAILAQNGNGNYGSLGIGA